MITHDNGVLQGLATDDATQVVQSDQQRGQQREAARCDARAQSSAGGASGAAIPITADSVCSCSQLCQPCTEQPTH